MMTTKTKMKLIALTSALLIGGLTTSLMAQPEPADGAPEGPTAEQQQRHLLREYLRTHMELGQYYLLAGDYESASAFFLTVAEFEVPERPDDEARAERRAQREERRAQRDERRADRDEDGVEEDGRRGERRRGDQGRRQRHRRHNRADAMRARCNAYVMAATATWLSGDEAGAIAIAESAQALLPEQDEGRRGPRMGRGIERFLQDPGAFAARFEGGPNGLEARLLEIEAELSNNVDE